MRRSIRTFAAVVAVLIVGTGGASAGIADGNAGSLSSRHATAVPVHSLPGQAWGIATGYKPLYYDDETLARYLDAIRAVGVQYVRTDINLRQISRIRRTRRTA